MNTQLIKEHLDARRPTQLQDHEYYSKELGGVGLLIIQDKIIEDSKSKTRTSFLDLIFKLWDLL